ncbi:MAG: discoidin domain-containing protein [Segetibacter sp.]|nr:discoidin domain-containing protein [Segetibacter sp.]
MKKIKVSIFSLILATVFACNKPTTVLFADMATAVIADKTGWTVTADSETPTGAENTGKASAVIDGNIATYWHTDNTVSPVPGYPHWLLIDMKSDKNIISVTLTNRQAATAIATGMKKFKLEGSKDGTAFTSLGEFSFAITNNAQRFAVSSANAYRYLKLTALESQTGTTPHTFLAEIDVAVAK